MMPPLDPPGLTDERRAVLAAILSAPLAWSGLAGLGWCRETVADLEASGYLVRWTPDGTDEVLVTLTPWGAERIGVELDEAGEDEHPVWREAPVIDRPVRLPAHACERRLKRPDLVPDPRGALVLSWDAPDPGRHAHLMSRLRVKPPSKKTRKKSRKRGQSTLPRDMGAAL